MATGSYFDFLKILEKHGNQTALIDAQSEESYSYAELGAISRKLTVVFAGHGLSKGDRLLLYGVRGIDWVPLFLAAQLSGIIIVPIDIRANKSLVENMIRKTEPVIVINDTVSEIGRSSQSYKSRRFIKQAQKMKETPELKPISSDHIGQILLTSGTWSQPKGVTLEQSNVLHNMEATLKIYKPQGREVLLSILPLSHAYEQMCGLHVPLYSGWSIVYLDEILGDKIKAALKKYKVSLIVAVPRILDLFQKGILAKIPLSKRGRIILLAKLMRYAPIALRRRIFKRVHAALGPDLRRIIIGGAPLKMETDAFFQGLGYKTMLGYGLSETAPIISIHTRQHGRRQGDVGSILENVKYKINEMGELLVRGPCLFHGYWPEKRKKNAWFNTGDIVDVSKRSLRLLGRSKNMIIFSTGDKVVAEEVESLINGLESVEESIVLSQNEDAGISKGLVIVYKSAKSIDEDDIKKRLDSYLPTSARIIAVHNIHPTFLERTHTMKLARKRIHDKFISQG